MPEAAIVSAARTPIGKAFRGAFNQTHGATMAGHVITHAIQRAGIDPAEVEDVVVGTGLPEGATGSLTGHIDFLQVRNRAVHILDYKPDARTNRPIAQLTVYALALTKLVPGLKLFDIKCAWFNEEEYLEFFPRTLFAR